MAGGNGDRPPNYWGNLMQIAGIILALIALAQPLMMESNDRMRRLEQVVAALCERSGKSCPQ